MSLPDRLDAAGTASLAFLEELFDQYVADPMSVDAQWREYFEALDGPEGAGRSPSSGAGGANGHAPAANGHASTPLHGSQYHGTQYHGDTGDLLVTPDGIATAHAVAVAGGNVRLPDAPVGEAMPLPLPVTTGNAAEERVAFLQDRVDQLVRAYRVRGHLMAEIDPLGRPRPGLPELEPGF